MASSYDALVQTIESVCSTSGKSSFESGPVHTDRGEMSVRGEVLPAPVDVVDMTSLVDAEYWTHIDIGISLPDYAEKIAAAIRTQEFVRIPVGTVQAGVTLGGFDGREYRMTLLFDPTHNQAYRIKPNREFTPTIVVEIQEKLAQALAEALDRIMTAHPAQDLERYEHMFGMLDYYLRTLHDWDWQ